MIEKRQLEADVTYKDLKDPENGPLLPLLNEIRKCWCTDDGKYDSHRAERIRCGTIYISNDAGGNGKLVLELRFPLDLD